MLSSITALFIVRSLWFSWLKVLNCLKRDWGQSTQNPNSQKAFLFQCIDNCAISNTTLALASRGHSRCVTISYCHCWTLCCFHRIGERCWCWWSTKLARGAELQYLRQLWHGGEARFGFNLVWFETNGGRVDRREGDAEMWHRGELLHRDTFVAAFANNFFVHTVDVKEQAPNWLLERWRPFDEVFSTWMQSRWTMLPGLTISWPALQKGDFDVWQLLSEGAIIDGN